MGETICFRQRKTFHLFDISPLLRRSPPPPPLSLFVYFSFFIDFFVFIFTQLFFLFSPRHFIECRRSPKVFHLPVASLLLVILSFTLSPIFFRRAAEAAAVQPFSPVWHTPNDFNIDGQRCELLRPPKRLACPVMGILVNNRNAAQFSQACQAIHPNFGCRAPEHLFVDGICRECLPGFVLMESNVDVWCENPTTGERRFKDLPNPFDCQSSKHLPRQVLGSYRPCYGEDVQKVIVPNYYAGYDLGGELRTAACANYHGLSHRKTVVTQNEKTSTYDFPLVLDSLATQDLGYLQCESAPLKSYSFTSPGWWFWYGCYIFGISVIVIFAIYKGIRERTLFRLCKRRKFKGKEAYDSNHDSVGKRGNRGFSDDGFEYNDDSITQTGYSDDLFGFLSYIILWLMSIGWLIALVMIVLDMYGLHLFTLCNDSELHERCKESFASGTDPDWRGGYTCASGCLLSWRLINGEYLQWPYAAKTGGGKQIQLLFIIIWHVSLVWFVCVKLVEGSIRSFFRVKCRLEVATTVLCRKPAEEEVCIEAEERSRVIKVMRTLERMKYYVLGKPSRTQACKVYSNADGTRFYDFQCLRCCWSEEKSFSCVHLNIGRTQNELLEAAKSGLSSSEAVSRRWIIGQNEIPVEIPNIFVSFWEEFFDYFYFYQFFCLWVWFGFFYWPMGTVILMIVLMSGTIKVLVKRSSQKQVKKMAEVRTRVRILRDGEWWDTTSEHVTPGDLLCVLPNEPVPCDCVLINGRCVVDESSLTGEPTPVPKIPIGPIDRPYEKSGEDMKYSMLAGTFVESISPGSSGNTIALAVCTGAQTEKGDLIRSILFPPPLTFKFDQHWRVVFFVLAMYGFVALGITVYMVNGLLDSWFYGVQTLSQMLSPLIPAVFVAGETNAVERLKKKRVYCVSLHRIMVAGKLRNFCFDKTGTLTKSGLEFYGVQSVSVEGKICETYTGGPSTPPAIRRFLGCCHELDICEIGERDNSSLLGSVSSSASSLILRSLRQWGRKLWRMCPFGKNKQKRGSIIEIGEENKKKPQLRVVGNEVDRAMFEASGFEIVEACAQPIVRHIATETRVKVLRRFEFDRGTMTMSAIVEDLCTGKRWVYCKGGYERIAETTKLGSLPADYDIRTRNLAKEGFYVLGMSYSEYHGPEDVFEATRESVECNLTLLGLMMFRNDLKSDTADVIRELKEGNIRPVMITGDNALTATKISRECGLSTAKKILLAEVLKDNNKVVKWEDLDSGKEIKHPLEIKDKLETGEVELAVTGAAFNILWSSPPYIEREVSGQAVSEKSTYGRSVPNPTAMRELARYTRIYSRMKPNQKVDAVSLNMELGMTGMCGDGANDAAALRMAHCGIALSAGNSEATIVASFSTPHNSLSTVVEMVKEGRCALATAVAGYKALILYGEIMVLLSFVSYYFSAIPAEAYWITIDSVINISMSWAILQSRPSKTLSPSRPSSKLLGIETFTSVFVQVLNNWFWTILTIILLFQQSWFLCKEFDANLIDMLKWWLKGDNFESEVLGLFTLYNFLSCAAIFNFGFDYRRSNYRNLWLVSFYLMGLGFITYLLFAPTSVISCFYRTNCGDYSLIQRWGEVGWIPKMSSRPVSMPPGCPCTSYDCEAEYENCQEDHYNQVYHHNILPYSFRWLLFGLVIACISCGFMLEGFFVVGPVRSWLRRRKNKREAEKPLEQKKKRLIVGKIFADTEDVELEPLEQLTPAFLPFSEEESREENCSRDGEGEEEKKKMKLGEIKMTMITEGVETTKTASESQEILGFELNDEDVTTETLDSDNSTNASRPSEPMKSEEEEEETNKVVRGTDREERGGKREEE